ncbi:MAG TPA: DUF1552 domain-containing protein [Gemmataceae bacterium]|nr:DUF1552 domain-containing protein [Gemmataceae bacterium]
MPERGRYRHWSASGLGLVWLALVGTASAAEPRPAALDRDFRDRVRPVVEAHCIACHGPDDQVLANHFGKDTVQASLVLGCEQPTTGYHESNFSLAYSSHISWQNVTSPVPMEVYPSLAFDALFDNRGNQRAKSILDRVKSDAEGLSGKVSSADKAKLDEYLTSVREIEKRVEAARGDHAAAADSIKDHGPAAVAAMKRPDNGLPEDLRDHMRLMCDIIALGFQTDKTRVASL